MPGCYASRMFTVCHSRCPAWSDVTDFPDGRPLPGQLWPGHRFLSGGPLARPSLAVTPPTRATLIRSLASRPASACWQAPGAGISRGWCLLMGLVPLPPHLAR